MDLTQETYRVNYITRAVTADCGHTRIGYVGPDVKVTVSGPVYQCICCGHYSCPFFTKWKDTKRPYKDYLSGKDFICTPCEEDRGMEGQEEKPVVTEQVSSSAALKLDLGCGETCREGFEGVDKHAPNAKYRVDLFSFPWPWADNSVDELHCSHFIEHIPMEYCPETIAMRVVPEGQGYNGGATVGLSNHPHAGKDMLCAFMDECYRILKPNGKMTLIWPSLQSVRAFQDPTHRRFIPAQTLLYFSAEWRKANKLEHYGAKCNFGFNVVPSTAQEETLKHPIVSRNRINELWNVAVDFHATLQAIKT